MENARIAHISLNGPEHMAVQLTSSARRFLGAGFVALFLPLGDIGQSRVQSFVLDDRGLIHLLQFVEGAIGQVAAFMPGQSI